MAAESVWLNRWSRREDMGGFDGIIKTRLKIIMWFIS